MPKWYLCERVSKRKRKALIAEEFARLNKSALEPTSSADKEEPFYYLKVHVPEREVVAEAHPNWFYEHWLYTHVFPVYSGSIKQSEPTELLEQPFELSYLDSKDMYTEGMHIPMGSASKRRRSIAVQGVTYREVYPSATVELHSGLGLKWYYLQAYGARRRIAWQIMHSYRPIHVHTSSLFVQTLSDISGKLIGGFTALFYGTLGSVWEMTKADTANPGKRVAYILEAGTSGYFQFIWKANFSSVFIHWGNDANAVCSRLKTWSPEILGPAHEKLKLAIKDADLEKGEDPGLWYPLIERREREQQVMNGSNPLTYDVRYCIDPVLEAVASTLDPDPDVSVPEVPDP
ncbi:hypothetical protein BJ508DRAFT_331321 [Ascobolus immersus RN42]|uniref:Uncharacterized protein n=1 Tax=Ascobolus immersus RN42 TaxID=1160509 RepID=A0A3N4HRA8_ASCIM|nr:hypothetical protein BJ508DRAFT_331321 [Ascobolus immersus RN42]